MKFPRTLISATFLCVLAAITTACGGGSTSSRITQPITPPPPPTGTNYTTCNSQQVPNWQSSLFVTPYQTAISDVVNQYGGDSRVEYIRIGLGRGGEINLPQGWNSSSSGSCYGGYTGKWGYTVGGSNVNSSTWNTYLSDMVTFEGGLQSPNPLLVSITPVSGASPSTVTDDFIAPIAVANNMSFGNQGLEASDITNFPSCGGDWCNLFAQYHPAIAELQTLGQSCPTGTSCANSLASSTGPLDPLLPFATSHGANDLEIYYQDWLVAFDSDYATSVGATASSAAYAAAIQAAAATGAKMQVLFPPQSSDNTMCGSQTCYAATQQLLSNQYVTGFVIDVDWSDFQPNNGTDSPDWTITEATISQWATNGKKVALVLQNTTYGGSGSCPGGGIGSNGNVASNCAMPAWMWTVLQ
jgi:hypothetical protein